MTRVACICSSEYISIGQRWFRQLKHSLEISEKAQFTLFIRVAMGRAAPDTLPRFAQHEASRWCVAFSLYALRVICCSRFSQR